MNRENNISKLFTRRMLVWTGAQLCLFGVLAGRMYFLQVVESDKYKTLSDENRINLRLLPPPRGRILDRFGEPLAVNQLNYRVVVIAEQTGSVPETLDVLSNILPISDTDRRRIMREVARKRRFLPVTVRDNLSWDEVSRISVNSADLPGVTIDVGSSRSYPWPAEMAHVVGYVAPPDEKDLTGDPLLELPDFRVGRNGIERIYDLALRGRAGTSQVEVNALGRPIRELARAEGEPGHDINLTLDLHMQRFAMEKIAPQESAAAVLLDARNGEILALASAPTYDPNEFTKGISGPAYRSLLTNIYTPLINKAVGGQYAPGSTFKMVVAMAALEAGAITPEQRVFCPGHLQFGDHKFHCWKKGGHGSVDMIDGLKYSCDVYFYEVAKRVGVDRIAQMAKRFGLGQTLGVDVPGERPGIIPTRAWKQAITGQPWHNGETLVAGIGQGYIVATPLQLAVMAARIANGGLAVVPHICRQQISGRKVDDRPEPAPASLGVSPQILSIVQRGMRAVVNDPRGTAFKMRITDPAMAMCGKTGTSQVRRITEEERRVGLRKPEQVPWKERDHALFVAFAPADEPRYACAVVVEHGGGGSTVAAPIARDILAEVQKRAKEKPEPGTRLAGEPPEKTL
jgi:penicillin-binding protein 2